jgi:hypothetical protein
MIRAAAAALGLGLIVIMASTAAANDVTANFSCSGVTITASNFPNTPGNEVDEIIYVDGNVVAQPSLIFDGPSGSNTVSLSLVGDHLITVYAAWNSNGTSGHFYNQETVTGCGGPPPCTVIGSINSNFNGTAVVGVSSGPAFIWFNSNISLKNMPAGTTVSLTGSQVLINGVPHAVPDAKITFSAVSCATTTFDTGSNTWLTTVPLAGSDEIFLSGLAFPVTNLPGGAVVTWQGNFALSQPGVCLQWKWGAAAYSQFTTLSTSPLVIDYNAANIKPAHSASCSINNGDHAGTPQNPTIRASVTGGARGGGGSNFTGSWSGTGSVCPVCPPAGSLAGLAAMSPTREGSDSPVQALSFAMPRPNPATSSAALTFTLPRAASVTINVFDVSGRVVSQVVSGDFSAGTHTASWNLLDRAGNRVTRGMYFVRLSADGRVFSHSLIVGR